MAILGLIHYAAFAGLCLLVLTPVHHEAQVSTHSFLRTLVEVFPPEESICASSVLLHGYKCEELQVTTKDGYILSLQRIPEGRAGVNGSGIKQPVILQHGVLVDEATTNGLPNQNGLEYANEDGMTWLLNSPEQDLPLILADNGFDVWIANTRGTRHSRRHISLDPSNPAFWDWSFDELISYDLPAVFDYVTNETGQKVYYVGHSLATLIALASFSEGNLVNQLKSVALLSPVAYLSHMSSAFLVVAANTFLDQIISFGRPEFDPKRLPGGAFLNYLCVHPGVDCKNLMTAIAGENCCLNSTTLKLFLLHEPQSSSRKNLIHLAQIVRHGVLAKFNYVSPALNFIHYGHISPPMYDLANIPHDLPLFISYGGQDALADAGDVATLLDILKNHDEDKLSVQFIKEYAHADFVMGYNANDKVYKNIISFFNR